MIGLLSDKVPHSDDIRLYFVSEAARKAEELLKLHEWHGEPSNYVSYSTT